MTPERWHEIEDVLQGALDRPPQERASFLNEACFGDEQLKDEATSLINAYDEAGDFIEQPALARDAKVLVGADIDDKIGSEVGPYKIIERLGAGGMGEVYLAEDARLDRLVALKILPAYFASDDTRLRRFQREARAASALNHPNILTIHEVGDAAGIPYISTEFIDGATLGELIRKEELSFAEVLDIAEQVASALAAAHAAGIVHRDIKPENIMRRTDGLVKILDFGIAKLLEPELADYSPDAQSRGRTQTEAGLVMGTVNYMSPEQARGLPVDERTDLWSLGVVLYEMLARRLPFSGATRIDTMVAILEREPAPLGELANDNASRLFQAIVNKCLRKEMAERSRTANELIAELKTVRAELNSPSSLTGSRVGNDLRTGSAGSAPKESHDVDVLTNSASEVSQRRHIWAVLGVVALLLVVIATTVLYRRSSARARASVSNQAAAVATTGKLYSQMNEAERFSFVNEQEQRISTMMGDRPVKLHEDAVLIIKQYVDRYAARNGAPELGGENLKVTYARAAPYVPLIAREFAARKVPVIIGIYLPMIESAYRPCYENSIGAKGLFQFLPQTAEHYGVARADMCDVKKMAPAAAHYIADRMAEMGEDSQSLTLVLLSYNTGPEFVRDALRQLRGTDNYERNFWTLFAHRNQLDESFQREGARYVPSFFAAAIVGENPEMFELQSPPLSGLAKNSGQ